MLLLATTVDAYMSVQQRQPDVESSLTTHVIPCFSWTSTTAAAGVVCGAAASGMYAQLLTCCMPRGRNLPSPPVCFRPLLVHLKAKLSVVIIPPAEPFYAVVVWLLQVWCCCVRQLHVE
jgi:hypothetical protein